MLALKDFMSGLGSPNIDCRQDGAPVSGPRASYILNSTIEGLEEADAVLIVGANPRWEAALVNARLRKGFLHKGLKAAVIGEPVDLTFETEYLGAGPETLKEIAAGKGAFAEVLKGAERPAIIVGSGALARADGASILGLARNVAETYGMVKEGWNGFNVLQRAASRVGGLDLGFLPGEGGKATTEILAGCDSGEIEAVYLLGADEIDMNRLGEAFVIYQGHHGDAGAHRADVILPGAAYTEKNATYVNVEGRVQLARLAVFPPGEAREDWTILRALSEVLGERLPYNNLGELRAKLIEANPVFAAIDQIAAAPWEEFGDAGEPDGAPFVLPVDNFYMTDPISRASKTMAECTEVLINKRGEATGTDG